MSVLLSLLITGCAGATSSRPLTPGTRFLVVAAESSWGSIAGQLAGTRAEVRSVIENPGTDPHSYTPTAGDSRLLAESRLAIVNGIGYDRWASQALAANPDAGRVVVDTGRVLGLGEGANPHQWYRPAAVARMVGVISSALARLDPTDAAYFAGRRQALLSAGLAAYDRLRAEIRRRFAGTPVGYSESIFEPLGRDLGLVLATPASFARAIAEGTEVTAQDRQTVERQAGTGQIRVWIENSQNLTPDVRRVSGLAAARRIPVVAVTETLSPAGTSFEDWQAAQLSALRAALHRATGR
ncbi:MAG: zinc/manganese transport system substrate-binding protein [Solirubrobacteraceae bacterium]|nr:zinc/manganese transport system substrate-binding protein [Solirubrobacteraceae bacterium]